VSGIPVRYPDGLPCPATAPLSPTQRVLPSDLPGPTRYRGFQRDFHATQQLEWIFTAQQAQQFHQWWSDTLRRGGLWFAADWPLLSGRIDNVYRFASPPAWQYIAGGANGEGMHRVRAAMEVRGRGMPPRDYDVLLITSRPYPVELQESLGIHFGFGSGQFMEWPIDHMAMGFGFVGGDLREPLVDYSGEPEEMGLSFGFESGELRNLLIEYDDALPEELAVAFGFVSGQLVTVLVQYEEWPPEEVGLTFGFVSGTLA
jgi:hypothetical protein